MFTVKENKYDLCSLYWQSRVCPNPKRLPVLTINIFYCYAKHVNETYDKTK